MWTGELAPRRALQLVGGLLDISRSRYRALVSGDPLLFGWDHNTSLLADINDGVTILLLGLSGKKAGVEHLSRRPKPRTEEDGNQRPATVEQFNVAWFMNQL